MGIQVHCPHGHVFKVKNKYAGKKGLCPRCEGQVVVQVPDVMHSNEAERALKQARADEIRAHHPVRAGGSKPVGSDSSVFDDHPHEDASSSGSLLSSSVIRHNRRCECGASAPMWFAKCPGCGKFFEHR
ncbi:hypothetical protein Mal64_29200 [Pseudobythopirellula maris]|uniref:Uncharacterized protein n=1 Tax=Pseudobythopirellula maris TaxID=2527991 RepID=A0A5C5ZKQ6_9BACT|nr:hypothetical protein [Pseudobythopirellula maris]TWT87381.1 hypothetical protein Mal64_29200 [Pseudobythopirellula maris]